MDLRPRPRPFAGLLGLLVLVAAAAGSVLGVRPPDPLPEDAPAEQFSAARAQVHLERIAAAPRPTGSPDTAEVRSYLEAELAGLGLRTQSQETVGSTGVDQQYFAAAPVHNVVAVLPGTDPTGRVFLIAHHDTQPLTPGASDDGAGVAALLETARALAQGPRPRNDVVLVLTDAEENFLLGAEAFVNQHPLAADGGVLLNLEARGSAGPVIAYGTTPGNAELVALLGDAVPSPVATSFAQELGRRMSYSSDFGIFAHDGRFAGWDSANIDGAAAYHRPEDRPGDLDPRTLQHHGTNALALARALGSRDVPALIDPTGPDATHFPVLGRLVRYPAGWTWPSAVLAVAAVVGATAAALRRGTSTGPRAAAGLGAATVPLAVAPLLAQGLWLLLTALRPGYAGMLDPWRPGWYRAAVLALVAAVVLAWYALFRRRIGAGGLTLGALGVLALTGVVLAAVAPGAAHLATVPAVGGALAVLAAGSARTAVVAAVSGGVVSVLVLVPTTVLMFPALGLAGAWSTALVAAVLALTLVPVHAAARSADAPARRQAVPASLAAAAAVACVVTGLAVDRFDTAHPAPSHLAYALDADTGRARWVSSDRRPGDWAASFVTGREELSRTFPVLGGAAATGPAPAAALPAPRVRVESDAVVGDERTVLLRIEPRRRVQSLHVSVPDGVVLGAELMGREARTRGAGGRFEAWFFAPPPEGATLRLVLAGNGPVSVRVLDVSHGLEALPGFRPRPPGTGAGGDRTADAVVVGRTEVLG